VGEYPYIVDQQQFAQMSLLAAIMPNQVVVSLLAVAQVLK